MKKDEKGLMSRGHQNGCYLVAFHYAATMMMAC